MVLLTGLLMPNRKTLKDEFAYSKLKHLELVDPDVDLETGILPLGCQSIVKELGEGGCTVDAEIVHVHHEGASETLALPPGTITVELPSEFQSGQQVSVSGPHGRIMQVDLPIHAQPGGKLNLKLAPPAELRIQVPLGKKPCSQMKVRRANGVEIIVTVPKGVQPGSSFEATPPVLMVSVPENSKPGDFVVFCHHEAGPDGSIKTQRCRAQVPNELLFGRYLAARLPKQIAKCAPATKKKGWGVLKTQAVAKPMSMWVGTIA